VSDTAGFYDRLGDAEAETSDEIIPRLVKAGSVFRRRLVSAKRILDIGCGRGTSGLYLGQLLQVEETYGVEISPSNAQVAAQRGVRTVVLDVDREALPFEDSWFDAIFCGEVIEHLVDPDHLLGEIHRTLAPGGLCVLTTPNLAAWQNRIALMPGWQPFNTEATLYHVAGRPRFLQYRESHGHLRVLTYKAVRDVLAIHGLSIVEARGVTMHDCLGGRFRASASLRLRLLRSVLSVVDSLRKPVRSLSWGILVAVSKETRGG
jgi:SAM-dependent methyltransferase